MRVLVVNSCCSRVLGCVLALGFPLSSLHGHSSARPLLLLLLLQSAAVLFPPSSCVGAESAEVCGDPAWEPLHSLIRDLKPGELCLCA